MNPTVYVETTVVSYLAGKKSKDFLVRTHQQITSMWWKNCRQNYGLYISDIVASEAGRGDPGAAMKRMAYLKNIPMLGLEPEIEIMAERYARHLNYPPRASLDALHLAFAVYYQMDYLLTWNCTHLANEFFQRRIVRLNNDMALTTPLIVTPETLLLLKGES